MKTYFYKRVDGNFVRIEAEQMFWSGVACVFVIGGSAAAVVVPLAGEFVIDEALAKEGPHMTIAEGQKLN